MKVQTSCSGHLLGFIGALVLFLRTNANVIPNSVLTGVPPRVYCFQNGLKVAFRTEKPFVGRIYVKGMYNNPQCAKLYTGTTTDITLPVAYEDCVHKLDRLSNPPGMAYMLEIVVQFHPHFTTKIDRGFVVTCMYREGLNTVTSGHHLQGNVDLPPNSSDTIPVAVVSFSPQMPKCKYTIHKGTPDGPIVSYARIGEMLFHKWQCYPSSDGEFHGILVHSCLARDSHGNHIQLLDRKGCSLDIYAMPTPQYTSNLTMAFVEVHAFKFADDMTISFQPPYCKSQYNGTAGNSGSYGSSGPGAADKNANTGGNDRAGNVVGGDGAGYNDGGASGRIGTTTYLGRGGQRGGVNQNGYPAITEQPSFGAASGLASQIDQSSAYAGGAEDGAARPPGVGPGSDSDFGSLTPAAAAAGGPDYSGGQSGGGSGSGGPRGTSSLGSYAGQETDSASGPAAESPGRSGASDGSASYPGGGQATGGGLPSRGGEYSGSSSGSLRQGSNLGYPSEVESGANLRGSQGGYFENPLKESVQTNDEDPSLPLLRSLTPPPFQSLDSSVRASQARSSLAPSSSGRSEQTQGSPAASNGNSPPTRPSSSLKSFLPDGFFDEAFDSVRMSEAQKEATWGYGSLSKAENMDGQLVDESDSNDIGLSGKANALNRTSGKPQAIASWSVNSLHGMRSSPIGMSAQSGLDALKLARRDLPLPNETNARADISSVGGHFEGRSRNRKGGILLAHNLALRSEDPLPLHDRDVDSPHGDYELDVSADQMLIFDNKRELPADFGDGFELVTKQQSTRSSKVRVAVTELIASSGTTKTIPTPAAAANMEGLNSSVCFTVLAFVEIAIGLIIFLAVVIVFAVLFHRKYFMAKPRLSDECSYQ